MGRGAIVIGLAAVIIGEVIFSKLFQNFALKLLSAVIGAIIYYVVIQFVLRLGLDTNDLKLLTRPGGGRLPGHPLLEGKVLLQARRKGGATHA